MHYNIGAKKDVVLFLLMEKTIIQRKGQGLVGDHFTDPETLKKLPGKFAIGHNRYSTTGETS